MIQLLNIQRDFFVDVTKSLPKVLENEPYDSYVDDLHYYDSNEVLSLNFLSC